MGDGEGTTSADEPVVAVGDQPYTGHNPPKYLNAEFNSLEVMQASGEWVSVEEDGREVGVTPGEPVKMRASIGNNGWAKWLSPAGHAGDGAVYLVTTEESAIAVRRPIPEDVPRLGDAEIEEFEVDLRVDKAVRLTFEMLADGKARFGEKLEVVLLPEE